MCLSGTPAKSFTIGERVSIESALRGVAEVYTPKDFELNRIMADVVRIVEDTAPGSD